MDKNQHTIVIQTLNLSYDTSAKIKDVLNGKCYLRECTVRNGSVKSIFQSTDLVKQGHNIVALTKPNK